ncbi:MAG: glycoside hydrolase family 2 TIM barrel-domain containing protein [Anaerohalosphaeraceae bacterium]
MNTNQSKTKTAAQRVFLFLLLLISFGPEKAKADASPRIVLDFDWDWKFLKEDAAGAQQTDFEDSAWRMVNLPHDWSIEGPYSRQWASGTGYLPGGIGWYRKTFTAPSDWKNKTVLIEFDGVYKNSEVWLNGQFLGKRPFGYIGFQYDLTDHLLFDSPNVLAVRVDHSDFADSRWYTGSGIYRHVRLIITDKLRILPWGVFIQSKPLEGEKAAVSIETALLNGRTQAARIQIVSSIFDAQNRCISRQQDSQTIQPGKQIIHRRHFTLENIRLWSPDNPVLYRLETAIVEDGKPVDQIDTPFGIRSIRFDPNEGFFLNGQNLKIKGVCLHHDGGPLGAAVPEKLWQFRLTQLKEIGCNAIRTSHNPPAPELLDLCDRMGFLVMDEAFDEYTPPKKKWIEGWNKGTPGFDGYGKVFEEWAVRDIQDMVRRDRNHPSIILWSIGNEIDFANDPFSHPSMGAEYKPDQPPAENLTKLARPLAEAVRALDSTRPITAALANAAVSNLVGFADLLDVVGYNYQEQRYAQDHQQYPSRCILGSENSMSFAAWKAVLENPYVSGQFLWIGYDYLGEAAGWPVRSWTRGLFDLCNLKKPIAWQRQAWWSDKPMVYLAAISGADGFRRGAEPQSHWNWPAGSTVTVLIYSNCQEVELILNGKSLGVSAPLSVPERTIRRPVPFESGTLTAVGRNGGKEVCRYTLTTAGAAEQIRLIPDCTMLRADGRDIALVEFFITDANGTVVPSASDSVSFDIRGPGRILAVGNGDPACHENHKGKTYPAYRGRGLLIVQSERQPGTIEIKAAGGELKPAVLTLKSQEK